MGAVVADFEPGGGRSEGVGEFFRAVTQAVLLFGAETWVLTPRMERFLSSFNTGSFDGSPGGSRGDGGVVFGNTPH